MAKNNSSIFAVNWSPKRGGLVADASPKDIQEGGLYVNIPESGGINIRSIGKGTNVSPGYEPVVGNTKIAQLDDAAVQRKEFLITVDLGTVSAVNSDMDFDITTPSGQVLFHISSTVIIPPDADTCATQLITDINTTAASLNPVMVKTVVSGTQATISLYFDINTGYDFLLSNMVGGGGIDLTYTVTQDAISIGQLGNWHLIGSCNQTGDSFEFWTTKQGDTLTTDITGAVNNGGEIQITSVGHGLVSGEVVTIGGVTGTVEANGTWMVTVIDADNFTLDLSAFAIAYISGGVVYSKVVGLGEIGVVYQTGTDSDVYVRLLRSPQLNFSTVYQIDSRGTEGQDGRVNIYFTDNDLPYRVFYYKGAYVSDGAISTINPDGQYEYGTLYESLLLFLDNRGLRISFVDQIQIGGAIRSGNWRYSARFLDASLSPTEWSQPSGLVSVTTSSTDGSGYSFLGSAPNEVSPKINTLEITNPFPNVFNFVEIAAINYVGNAIQGFIIGRYVLSQEATQQINHTGNESNVVDLDVGELNRIIPTIKTGRNVELLDGRLILSDLTPAQFNDFTAWAETFRYRLDRDTIDGVGYRDLFAAGFLRVGEYQLPENEYSKLSHMMYEQYRYGVQVRMKSTGLWTPVFYLGYDIRIDLSASPEKDAGSFTTYDLTDNTAAPNPVNVYTVYINFYDFDLDFLVDGIAVKDLISEYRMVRADVIPEVLGSGVGIIGVGGIYTSTGIVGANMYYGAGASEVGPFPLTMTNVGLAGTLWLGHPVNPTYPNMVGFGGFTEVRDANFFHCPDQLYGKVNIGYRAGDQIISFGNSFRQYDTSTILGGTYVPNATPWFGGYTEYNGYTNNTVPSVIDIDEASATQKGQVSIPFAAGDCSLQYILYAPFTDPPALGDTVFPCERCVAMRTATPIPDDNGAGNADYGIYQQIYFRPQTNKYGDSRTTVYRWFSDPVEIGDSTGVVVPDTVIVYGDVHTQKSYIKQRYAGFASTWAVGFGGGLGYYSQNRINAQMKMNATPTTTPVLFPEYPIDSWLLFFALLDPQLLYYNKGYTPKYDLISANGFDSTFNYQQYWGNALMWSNPEVPGSNTDNRRLFGPLNIKFLDATNGRITDARAINNELITIQETEVLRQYFNTTETLTTDSGSEIILGDGGIMTRKGQTLTRFGCQHKWSVVVGRSDKGFDVLYWVDWNNKTVCRFGYNGNDSLDEVNGMKSFFANNLMFLWEKDNPANGEGICAITNQRFREVMWTMRGKRDGIATWSDIVDYEAGDLVYYEPSTFSTFEQTGEFYIALDDSINVAPDYPTDPAIWQLVSHTDNRFYNEYTIVFNELKEAFQAFHTPKPLIYAPYKNGYLVPRPVGNTGQLYIANKGGWTIWFTDDTGSQSGDAYFDAVINQPGGRKAFDNVRVESDFAPYRMEVTTPTGISFTPSADFEQREGNEFDAPVKNDSTGTGISDGMTSSMYGDWMITRLIIQAGNYNLINSFIMKLRMLARMGNR